MGLFNFVSNWRNLFDGQIDAKMTETLNVGLAVARAEVHVDSGYLRSTIGGEYNRSTKTVMLHADAPYALIEEARGKTRNHSDHHYLAPAARAMAEVWGGNLEIHLPNAVQSGLLGAARNAAREGKLYRAMGRAGRNTKIHSRRWHKRYPDSADHLIL